MLDSLVAGAQARGLQVLLTRPGRSRPGPRAAGLRGPPRLQARSQLFGAFVRALGTRYPTVKLWSIWNEPNLRSWLSPQYESPAPRPSSAPPTCTARSPRRRSPACARPGTAPIRSGSARPPRWATTLGLQRAALAARPEEVREQDPQDLARDVPARRLLPQHKGKKLTGTEGTDQHCGGYKKLNVTGYAHHPYTRGGSRPPTSGVNAGEITINVASRLTRLLDQAAKAKRIPAKLPIHYTEHGWQTNAGPDLRRHRRAAGRVHQPVRLDRVQEPARAHRRAVQDRRRQNIGAGFQMGLRLLNSAAQARLRTPTGCRSGSPARART